ncbi:MAG TPA: DUF1565 domain-containing protein [Candidatus Baltobacteraceae bacterium]|jgi:hypothetical protein
MSRVGRTLFVIVAAAAIALVIGSTACTRRGGNGAPPVVTPTPINAYYVNPVKGKDTNNGSVSEPFKTLTHALATVVKTAGMGITINLTKGTYSVRSGETFPIVIPAGVVVAGTNYGHSQSKGTFINGSGEDTYIETALNKAPHTFSATVIVKGGVSATLNQLYVGTSAVPSGIYASVDDFGTVTGDADTFGAGAHEPSTGGVLLPSGTLHCLACTIGGRDYGIEAFTLASATSAPSISLSGPGQAVISGNDAIRTDGTASVTASGQNFAARDSAYTDTYAVASPSSKPATVPATTTGPTSTPTSSSSSSGSSSGMTLDFGYGATGSSGGNTFGLAHSLHEIYITTGGATLVARSNTWLHFETQGTSGAGLYRKEQVFGPGTTGKNVTILSSAGGSKVVVGPQPASTPTPSPTPYYSTSPSPTASST